MYIGQVNINVIFDKQSDLWSKASPNYQYVEIALGNALSHDAGHLYGIEHPPAATGIIKAVSSGAE
jgi:hypothetical protein